MLGGTILRSENCHIDECGIMYSQQENFAVSQTVTVDLSTEGDFTVNLTGLEPGVRYYYCTYAKSGSSVVKGGVKQFVTPPVTNPSFGELQVSNVTQTSFDVWIALEDLGGATISEGGFIYVETNREVELEELMKLGKLPVAADTDGNYRLSVEKLTPNTCYAICAYVSMTTGTEYSQIYYVTTLEAEIPVVSDVTMNDRDGITQLHLSAYILASGTKEVTEYGFVYSTSNQLPAVNEDQTSKLVAEGTGMNFQATLPELLYNKTYYIRAYAVNEFGTGYGNVLVYTTDNYSFPIVTTVAATDIGEDFATLNGMIEDDGNSPILLRGFVWSQTNQNPTIEDNRIDALMSTEAFSATLTEGMSSSQTYYYRAYAVNGKGPGYGAVMSFTTITAYPPTLSSTTMSAISLTTATASSSISNDGGSAVFEKGFVLSATVTLPTVSDIKVLSASSDNSVVATLTGLADGTKYYIRSFATNKKGTAYGPVQVFNTVDKDDVTSIDKGDFSEDDTW